MSKLTARSGNIFDLIFESADSGIDYHENHLDSDDFGPSIGAELSGEPVLVADYHASAIIY